MHEDNTKLWRTLIKLLLMAVTGYMTWSALQRLMGADAWLVSALGLVAFEGGLLLWPMYYQQADTNTQSGIAAVMAVIDLLGVAMAFGVEVMGNNPGMAGLIPQFADVATWGVIGVVIANVAAYIVVDAIDPDKQLARQMAAQSRAQKTAQLFIARQAAQATLSGIQETANQRSEEHTSELQSPEAISYAVFCARLCAAIWRASALSGSMASTTM